MNFLFSSLIDLNLVQYHRTILTSLKSRWRVQNTNFEEMSPLAYEYAILLLSIGFQL